MKLFTAFVSLILPLLAFAAPTKNTARDAYIEPKRASTTPTTSEQYCYTFDANCFQHPHVTSKLVTTIDASSYWYACYSLGDCLDGNW